MCSAFKTLAFFKLISKCLAKTNCWKYKIWRNESGFNPPVPCVLCTCLDSKSKWVGLKVINLKAAALSWAQRMARNQLCNLTTLHQWTGLVPGARWSRLKDSVISTSLVSSCYWCSEFDIGYLCCLSAGNHNQEDIKVSAKKSWWRKMLNIIFILHM